MVQRVTYRRRLSYNTASNRIRKVRTPGSRVLVHYIQKKANGVRAPHDSCDCGKRVNGIPKLNSAAHARISRRQTTVPRAYGGVLCPRRVTQRIIRAFLLEEMKVVKRLANAEKVNKKK